jgi:hypothetical protein
VEEAWETVRTLEQEGQTLGGGGVLVLDRDRGTEGEEWMERGAYRVAY